MHRSAPSLSLVICGALLGCANGSGETLSSDDAAGLDVATDAIFPTEDAGDDGDAPCATANFKMTETQVVFTVPATVRYAHIKAWGAGGNGEGQCAKDGGLGGFSEGVFSVKPGDPLIIIVGKRGRSGMTGEDRVRFGFGDWGGGGLSGVFSSSALITDKDSAKAMIIAGGGGSAGAPGCNPGGTGNHADAGGMPTMSGGPGADSVNGGAGGFHGGSGGAKGKASLGGTGYVSPAALESRMLASERSSGAPPRTDDADYDGVAGKEESSGLVVIQFTCGRPVLTK